MNRLRLRDLGGGPTLAAVAAFLFLSLAVVTGIETFVYAEAEHNRTALWYERANTHLQMILRGLSEAAATEGSLASIGVVKSGLAGFQEDSEGSAEVSAEIAQSWPALEHMIAVLMLSRRNRAFDENALIELGRISFGVEGLATGLSAKAKARRQVAAQAERHTHVATLVAGALMVFGTLGVFSFIIRGVTTSRVLDVVRASEAQLRDITNAVPATICYVDADRRFRFHNRAAELDLGLTHAQINGRSMLEVLGEETYATLRDKVDQVLGGRQAHFESEKKDALGERHDFAVHYFPRYRDDREDQPVIGFYVLASDITHMKRIDRMKTEFVSTVSHELRTPLTSIRGSLGLLTGGVAGTLPAAARNLIDIAKNNCERLIRLINDILDTEKLESGQVSLDLKVVDLRALVAQTLVANEGFAGQHRVSLALHATAEEMRAEVDADRFVQALTNLLSNAIKFSPAQGTVDVTLSHNAGNVRVEVRDRGPGIPEEFRARIFQKFSQADSSDSRQKSGSGLGLNISRSIVERLGGTIGFTTEAGVGTRFFLELPQWAEMPLPASQPAGGARRPRILVCEDDVDIAHLIALMLDKAGYDSDLAGTAAAGREMAAAGSYAAMTVDLALPDQNGIALIRALREKPHTHDLPIVVVSANAERNRVQLNSQLLSVSDWLGKPIDENRLIRAIRHAVEGGPGHLRILHVEDDPDIQLITAAVAKDFGTFEFAASLREARARLRLWKFDLVILDLNLPEGEGAGWSLVADIDALEHPPPVVVFSAREVSLAERQRVAAVLVKASTSNEDLLETIERVLERHSSPRAPIAPAETAQAA